MRYSEMKAFEKERAARRLRRGGPPPRLIASPTGIPWWPILILLVAAAMLMACARPVYRDTAVPMTTVGPVDLDRYQGLWYEIARFPVSFEEGCAGVTAEYTLNPDGTVKVVNTCRQGSLDGPVEVAEGVATSRSPDNDRLRVSFVPWLPFAAGDYWILDLDPDYTVAVIGSPGGTAGWVLARTPSLSSARLLAAYDVLERNGYDIDLIMMTDQ